MGGTGDVDYSTNNWRLEDLLDRYLEDFDRNIAEFSHRDTWKTAVHETRDLS